MFKKANVVMLATNEKSPIFRIGNWNKLYNGTTVSIEEFVEDESYQHLYITSDEEIKENDWCILFDSFGRLFTDSAQQYIPSKGHVLNNGLRKVIATTDSKLIINIGGDTLPQPSQSFITKYIEEYNKGNIITEVMVEYEEGYGDIINNEISNLKLHIKVNSKDNTITIKKIKDSWTREEVVKLIKEYHASFASYPTMNLDLRDNWISKKL